MSNAANESPYYRIFLLTVWQEQSRGPPLESQWRYRLEDPRTGRQGLFTDAGTLMAALQVLVIERDHTDVHVEKDE